MGQGAALQYYAAELIHKTFSGPQDYIAQSTYITIEYPSSELGPPHPLSPQRVCPPLNKGHTRLGWGGGGRGPNSDN